MKKPKKKMNRETYLAYEYSFFSINEFFSVAVLTGPTSQVKKYWQEVQSLIDMDPTKVDLEVYGPHYSSVTGEQFPRKSTLIAEIRTTQREAKKALRGLKVEK